MDLCDDNPYAIYQTVDTISGKSYNLSFYVNENSCGTNNKTGYVAATGSQKSSFYYNAAEFKDWRLITYQFNAIVASTTITIGSSTVGKCGPVIDQISLYAMENSLSSQPPVADNGASNNAFSGFDIAKSTSFIVGICVGISFFIVGLIISYLYLRRRHKLKVILY